MSADVTDAQPVNVSAGVAGGQVVAHLPFERHRFLGSPSLHRLPDGDWLVSHDIFGRESTTSESFVHRSGDGEHWRRIARIDDLFWPTLFAHGGALHLLGTTREYGDLVILRSDDEGRTWTTPTDADHGLLATGHFHTAPVPFVEHRGRIWRGVESRTLDSMEWGHFHAHLMSAAIGSDLLRADSWEIGPGRLPDAELRERGCTAWLEGNAVVTPDGSVANLLRAHWWTEGSQRALLLDREGRWEEIAMPGGGSKFTVRTDPEGTYWTLANTALFDASPQRGLAARNTLSLVSSTDLRRWQVERVVLHHPDDVRHGFQYVDWQFDGADIVLACRTAHDFEGAAAHNYHDSNLITFHRIEHYAGEHP